MSLARGTVVLVDLEPTQGHEQQGTRPCVVVPVTGALYPDLAPGASGLN